MRAFIRALLICLAITIFLLVAVKRLINQFYQNTIYLKRSIVWGGMMADISILTTKMIRDLKMVT